METDNSIYKDFFSDWRTNMELAYKSGPDSWDWKWYMFFLRETVKMLSGVYADLLGDPEKASKVEIVEKLLKFATCELKENSIKYKKSKVPF